MTTTVATVRRAPLCACVLAAFGLSGLHAVANAGAVTDCSNDTGAGTLRDVIGAAANGDTVDASTCTNSTISLTGEIGISQTSLTIVGPSDNSLTISASHNGRVFDQNSGDLTLQHLKLADGQLTGSSGRGGCVFASGNLTLENTTISGCSIMSTTGASYALGGGVFAGGALHMTTSTISGSSVTATGMYSSAYGAGAYADSGIYTQGSSITGNTAIGHYASGGGLRTSGNAFIVSTTIDSNNACNGGVGCAFGTGGGVSVPDLHGTANTLTITDSTISGNFASNDSGGCYSNAHTTRIYNSTIAFNTAGMYGGGASLSGKVTLHSTIIANNTAPNGGADLEVSATALDGTSSHNLIMQSNNSPAGTLTDDPMLTPLANHGGPTKTHALDPASPALNAGDNVSGLPSDQRGTGFAREIPTGQPDIGAYERQVIDDELFYNGFE